jgi:hypothetical protein
MSSGIQGNYVDQAWAQNLPAYFKENVKPSIADDAFLIPRANIAIPDIVTLNTVGSVNNRGFIDNMRSRLSTIRSAILNPSTYVTRLHPHDVTSGTGGIDNLSNLSRFGQPLPFADGEDFPDFQYWSRYTKDGGADPLTAGYAVKVIGENGSFLASAMRSDRLQAGYKNRIRANMKELEAAGRTAAAEEDRRAQAERVADATAMAEEEERRREFDEMGDYEDEGEEGEGSVQVVGENDAFRYAADMANASANVDGTEFAAAGAPPAAVGEEPIEVEAEAAGAGAAAQQLQAAEMRPFITAREAKAMGFALEMFGYFTFDRTAIGMKRRFAATNTFVYRAAYVRPGLNDAYIAIRGSPQMSTAEAPDMLCKYEPDASAAMNNLKQELGYRRIDAAFLAEQKRDAELRGKERRGRPYALSDVGTIDTISSGGLSFRSELLRSSRAPSSMSLDDEENYAPSGGGGADSLSARSMSIAQSIAARSGVANTLRDQAPLLGPNASNWRSTMRMDVKEVEDIQEFMGSTTGNLAAIFSNAYTATPAAKRPRKQGVEGVYTKAGGSMVGKAWGSLYEPRVEQTTAASGDVFSTAEKDSDPRFALLHGRKPSSSTYMDPNLAYTSGTMRQLESQARSNRLDGNVDGPAEQNSLSIKNPNHARNMAQRVASEFARAPPESRQTGGMLNRNQRVPVSSVTIANRGSLSGDPATSFRAGAPRRR